MADRFRPFRFSRAGLRGLKASPTLSLNEQVREMWEAGRDVYQLGFGESRFPVHPKIAEALRANVQQRSYFPALGFRELRETIAQFYQRKFQMAVSPDQVVIGPGSKSLLYALLLALGDEVILPQPAWVSYAPQAHLLDKPVLWVPTRREQNYNLEIETLRQKMEEDKEEWGNPEVLVLNSPNNPTGTMLPPDKVQALADFAREEQLMVLSDEIYSLITHGQIPHVSMAHHYPEGTVVLGGLSKHLSLGGWRLGLAILPPGRTGEALRRAVRTVATSIWSCVTAPIQYAALVAYGNDPEIDEFVDLCTRMHAIRTRYLYDKIVEAGIPCAEPSGAFYFFPTFRKWKKALAKRGVRSCEDLAVHLLERYELATLPGAAFGSPTKDLCLRISSSYPDARTDEEASALVEAFKEDPDPDRFIENYHPRLQEAASRFSQFIADLEQAGDESQDAHYLTIADEEPLTLPIGQNTFE
jgi:aspartate/methionine/tyrosine aminotransferase